MAQITQQGAPLTIMGTIGSPFSITITVTAHDSNNNPIPFADFTNWTVVMESPLGTQNPANLPTITTNSGAGTVTLAWSATQTTNLYSGSWALEATINGVGPLVLIAGPLSMVDPTTPGAGTSSSASLTVTVGSATVSLAVTVGGSTGGGAVTSVFTRSGAVTAQTGDYTVSQVTGAAPTASPALTGTPTVPTATPLTDTTQAASTAYADAAVAVEKTRALAAEALLAPLASPGLTGSPTAPTKTALTNNTDIATTAYTDAAVAVETTRAEGAEALLAPLNSPGLTGVPTAPTASPGTNTTQLASTAFVEAALPTTLPPDGSAGGDLSSTYPNPTVAKINGTALGTLTATQGQGLVWSSGSDWVPETVQLTSSVNRTSSATLGWGERTVFTGSTANQTLTLPDDASNVVALGQANTVLNASSVAVTVTSQGMTNFAGVSLSSHSVLLLPGDTYTFVNDFWFVHSAWFILTSTAQNLPVFNVVAFGADPTGTSDSAAAIQAAINALPLAGGYIYFPPGTYKLNSTVTMGNGSIVETTAGSIVGSTLNVTSTPQASWNATGTILVYTSSTGGVPVTYTGVTASGGNITAFTGCTGLPTTSVAGLPVTQGSCSTRNGIRLIGPSSGTGGVAGGAPLSAVTFTWGGSAGGKMIATNGPVSGCEIANISFNAGGAGYAIYANAMSGGYLNNIYSQSASVANIYGTGFYQIYDTTLAKVIIPNTGQGSIWKNIVANTTASANGAMGIAFVGAEGGTEAPGGGTYLLSIENLFLILSDPGGGNTQTGLYFKGTDTIDVDKVYVFTPSSPAGTVHPILYDYGDASGLGPAACNVRNIYADGFRAQVVFAAGSPSTGNPFSPNVVGPIYSNTQSTGATGPSYPQTHNPLLAGVRWETPGSEVAIFSGSTNFFSTTVPKQIHPYEATTLYVTPTTSIAYTLSIQDQGGTVFNTSITLHPSSSPGIGDMATYLIPAGWFVNVTCGTMADLSMTAVTRPGG